MNYITEEQYDANRASNNPINAQAASIAARYPNGVIPTAQLTPEEREVIRQHAQLGPQREQELMPATDLVKKRLETGALDADRYRQNFMNSLNSAGIGQKNTATGGIGKKLQGVYNQKVGDVSSGFERNLPAMYAKQVQPYQQLTESSMRNLNSLQLSQEQKNADYDRNKAARNAAMMGIVGTIGGAAVGGGAGAAIGGGAGQAYGGYL